MLKEYIKKYEKSSILSSILMIIMAILLMIKPTTMLNTIIMIFGGIILVQGIISLILYFFTDKETRVFSNALLEGIICIIVALLILSNKEKPLDEIVHEYKKRVPLYKKFFALVCNLMLYDIKIYALAKKTTKIIRGLCGKEMTSEKNDATAAGN